MDYQAVNRKKSVVLLLGADISDGRMIRGGVVIVAKFIYETLLRSGQYSPHYISMATSFRDEKSVRLLSPASWKSGVQLVEGNWGDASYTHYGAFLAEFEFQRYMPRRRLTRFLNEFDLIQVVSGSPAIAYVTKHVNVPVCLFAATMTHLERPSALHKAGLLRKIYGYATLPLITQIDRRAVQHVGHVFAETLYTKQAIKPYISEDKISIDTIGVDTTHFQPIEEDARSDDYILSTGRLSDPRKNIALLFRAYAQLLRQMSDAPRLLLAGMSGPSESDWRLADELCIRDHIDFQQAVPQEQLISLYQNAAFLVLSSHEEGLGIVLLESMACATPVISTRCGGPDSIVSEDVGFLTPINDVETMADLMAWMLQNPEKRRQMGKAGRKMIESRFSYEVVGQKYLDVYDRLLNQ